MIENRPDWIKYKTPVTVAFFVNFIAFCVIAVMIGGDAINGRIEGDVHLLSAQGTDTAVHPLVWYYSLVHACIVIGSFVLFFIFTIASRLTAQPRP